MLLETIGPDYLDKINDGPFVPLKLVSITPDVPEHYVPKEKKD